MVFHKIFKTPKNFKINKKRSFSLMLNNYFQHKRESCFISAFEQRPLVNSNGTTPHR